MPDRIKPFITREPSKVEMAFSLGVVCIVTLLGLLILLGTFRIDPSFRVIVGLILLSYGLIRFWMLKSRYESLKGKESSLGKTDKEDKKKLRNL
jgi:hypothetical protein